MKHLDYHLDETNKKNVLECVASVLEIYPRR